MTVALAFADTKSKCAWIGTDSCASDPINHSIVRNNKVFHPVGRRDILIACAGTFRLPNLLQYIPGIFPPETELSTDDINMSYLVNEFTPVIRALVDDFSEDDLWEMLIAVGDRIYRMQMDLSIIEPADYSDAIGCGGSVALGAFKVLDELALYSSPEDRINRALKVACNTCQGCLPPCTIMHTEPLPEEILKRIPKKRESRGYTIERQLQEDDDESYDDKQDKQKEQKHNKNNKHKKKKYIM